MAGGYETHERRLIPDTFEAGDRILEIGASAGIVSCFLWRQVGSGGRVISVEADSQLRDFFECQLRVNGFAGQWTEAICFPAWTDEVPAEFQASQFRPAANSLTGSVDRDSPGDSGGGGGVPDQAASSPSSWKTARQLCEETGLEPTGVFVDVEGTETAWIEYPPQFPDSVRRVMVEFHPSITGPKDAAGAVRAMINEGFQPTGMSGPVIAFARD